MPSKPNSGERKLPEFAPVHPDYALAPGLFRSVPSGAHKRTVELVYGVEGGNPEGAGWRREVEFVSPYVLGPGDLRALQGLMALAAEQAVYWEDRSWVISRPEDELGRQLALRFEAKDDARDERVLQISGSLADLARAVGVDERSGKAIGVLKRSLKRLATVTVWLRASRWTHVYDVGRAPRKQTKKREGSYRLASAWWAEGDVGSSGALRAAVNPALSEVALAAVLPGGTGVKYIRMDMREVRELRTGAARLIHQRLCAWINPGAGGRVKLSTLCGYVYPEDAPTRGAAKKRRRAVRGALRELEGFDPAWGVEEYAPGRFAIARPGGVAGGAAVQNELRLLAAPEEDGGAASLADAADGQAVRRTVQCRVSPPARSKGERS